MKLDLIYMPVAVFALALITSIASRFIVNKEKVERCIEIIERWNEMREKAIRTKDRKLYRRVMKRKSMVDKAKSGLDTEKFKVSTVNMLIFVVGIWLMSNIFSLPGILHINATFPNSIRSILVVLHKFPMVFSTSQ